MFNAHGLIHGFIALGMVSLLDGSLLTRSVQASSITVQMNHRGEKLTIYVFEQELAKNLEFIEGGPASRANLTVTLKPIPATTGTKPLVTTSRYGIYEFSPVKRGAFLLDMHDGGKLYFSERINTRPAKSGDVQYQVQDEDQAGKLYRSPPLPDATPDALKCISLLSDRSIWYGNTDISIVKIYSVFRNSCERSVKMQLITSSGHQPRTPPVSDTSNWKPIHTLVTHVVLKPSEERSIEEILRWYRVDSTFPRLMRPGPPRLSASFVDQQRNE